MTKLQNAVPKKTSQYVKIKIAYIFNHSFFLGGGEISFYELIQSLNKKLYEPVIFVPETGEIELKLRSHNYEVDIIPLPSLKKVFLGLPIRAIFILTKLIKHKNIDLIHANGSRASFYAGIASRLAGVPAIWHVRETKKDLLLYEIILSCMAKAIICVSKSVFKKRFFELKKIISNKLYIVYNGVDTKSFRKELTVRKRIRSNLGVNGNLLFGMIGNIIPLKGQHFFLKGLAAAKKIKPSIQIKGLLIGRVLDQKYYMNLLNLVKKNGLANDILFLEYEKNIKNIFSALDVFVLTSKREGFSRSLLEAMSTGLPVIATRISEIEEAVIDRKNAILVEYKNIDEIAHAIIKMSDHNELRVRMGEMNRVRVKDYFDLSYHRIAVQNIYEKLVNGKCCI